MSKPFQVRRATPADADIIGDHRARMFYDMGDIPDHLFDEFRARSRRRLQEMLTSREYIGWLASPADSSDEIIGGAGVQVRSAMPHPLTSPKAKPASLKAITRSFLTSLPNRSGVDEVSPGCSCNTSSIGHNENDLIAWSCTLPTKDAGFTQNSALF